jgi:hypothetical protein
MGLALCGVAFVACLLLGRRSLPAGLGGVLTFGYLYGILRANYLDGFAHFIFDSAVLGFYASWIGRRNGPPADRRDRELRAWMLVLMGWAGVMFVLPLQHPLIQLVGLRGNAFLLPFLLFGGRLGPGDARRLAFWIALLNLTAIGFAVAEYFRGVPAFYPKNAVTDLIYKSNDVAGYTALRIPACFVTAHAFAGAMVGSLPWLLGAWFQRGNRLWQHLLLGAATAAAVLGVFMSATRTNFILLALMLAVVLLSGRMRIGPALALAVVLAGVGWVVSGEARLQRFLSLGETDKVAGRVEGSVNQSFFSLAVKYPIGNGLGAGGTSVPFFLQHLIHDQVSMENEYSRILLEEGWPGLGLWAGFVAWVVWRRPKDSRDPWMLGRRLHWILSLASFGLASLGIGLLTSIPQTATLLLGIGFLTALPPAPAARPAAEPVGGGDGAATSSPRSEGAAA